MHAPNPEPGTTAEALTRSSTAVSALPAPSRGAVAPATPRLIDRYSPARRALGAAWAILGLLVTILFGASSSLFIWPFAVLPRGRRERWSAFGMQYFAWMTLYLVLWSRIDFRGREHLPKGGGYLVVSNHRSWVDVALLQLLTKSQGVSKKEVAYIPFFGLNGWLTGAIFFDRTSKTGRAKVVSEAVKLLSGGANLHVFPEGTRTRTGRLADKVYFRLLQTASEHGFALVPACVWGTEEAVPAEGIYAMPGRRVGLEVGPPVPRAEGQTPEEHAEATWAVVKAMAERHRANEPFPPLA